MDATRSYRLVHRDPAVDALLELFAIGTLRPGPDTELYRVWEHALYALVEIANAQRLDVSILAEPLTRGEHALARTPYRLQFAVEAHLRFVRETVPIVSRHLARLWEATGGEGAFAEIVAEPAEDLEAALDRDGATPELEDRLSALLAADARFLETATSLIAGGVHELEQHGAAVDMGVLLDALSVVARDCVI
jgi:hypothetical protein